MEPFEMLDERFRRYTIPSVGPEVFGELLGLSAQEILLLAHEGVC